MQNIIHNGTSGSTHNACISIACCYVQTLISGLNRRLEQLGNEASKARDTTRRHSDKTAILEGRIEVLRNDNQRLLHDSTEHAAARWRLTAACDTQQRLYAQQHEQDAQERESLHRQLSHLQQALADSQAKLAEERFSQQHISTNVQTVQDAADVRYADSLSCIPTYST